MEMNSVEKIKNLTVNAILRDNHINEIYQDIMGDIINAASEGKCEITIDICNWDDRIKLEHIFKLLGFSVLRSDADWFSKDPHIKLNISWL